MDINTSNINKIINSRLLCINISNIKYKHGKSFLINNAMHKIGARRRSYMFKHKNCLSPVCLLLLFNNNNIPTRRIVTFQCYYTSHTKPGQYLNSKYDSVNVPY